MAGCSTMPQPAASNEAFTLTFRPKALDHARLLWQELSETEHQCALDGLCFEPWARAVKGGTVRPSKGSSPGVALKAELPWLSEALGEMFDEDAQGPVVQKSLRDYHPHHFHSCAPLDSSEPDAFTSMRLNQNLRNVRVTNHVQLREILAVLQPDGTVKLKPKQKISKWMSLIASRGSTFKLERFTDPKSLDVAVTSASALMDLLGHEKSFPMPP